MNRMLEAMQRCLANRACKAKVRLATVAWECNFLKPKVLEALENPVKQRAFSRAFLRSGATVKYH